MAGPGLAPADTERRVLARPGAADPRHLLVGQAYDLFDGTAAGVWTLPEPEHAFTGPPVVLDDLVVAPHARYGSSSCSLVALRLGEGRPLPRAERPSMFDTRRCLPYAYDRDCIVCEEHCPIPTKAIYFVEEEITRRDGSVRLVKRPRVDAGLCIGCGICETKCPFVDRAAVIVTSANESRHPGNQPIL